MVEICRNRDKFGVVLSEIIKKSNEISDIEGFLDFVLDILLVNFEIDGGTIYLFEDFSEDDIIISKNIDENVIKSLPYSFNDEDIIVKEDFDVYEVVSSLEYEDLSITRIPIISKSNIIGFILLKWEQTFFVDTMKREVLDTIGQSIGIAIDKVKLEEKLKKDKILLKESQDYNKKISEYFANLSHELRTPLNILINVFPLIEKEVQSKKFIRIAKQNSYRLLRLINNIIDISKMEANFFDIDLGNYNIVEIVEDITQSIAEYVKIKNIEIVFDTDIEEKIIACDPYMIERVILNLLSNSIKNIHDDGEVYVSVKDKGDTIDLSVKDNGGGIPEDKLEKIFDRFTQIDHSSLKDIQSSGIGLSLVKSIVELHNGNILVNSKVGKGTEFIINIPVHTISKNNDENKKVDIEDQRIERITVELSDIYGIDYNN
ncbi:GAF domain-containing sensor histidine kinase [Clostridium sp. D2Q-11]|uniref:histidine kinase n=1 Tax=Anaeromonas frigoriresistens TaxID=2683708 RepID=A0A942Z7Y7_9FIRM|nr:GAF domain-containing sensor histidine kinase [Anaeromonas frigoriresistens]MBS4537743.1 GAF domain-containing sensor histidine kinase [Anaeromonas frigoriresistens]